MLDEKGRELLKAIDEYLSQGQPGFNINSQELWSILTALRGPDKSSLTEGGYEVKDSTTAIIRFKAFPKAAMLGRVGTAEADSYRAVKCREALNQGHFRSHARDAFEVLGLKWDECN